MAETLPPPNPDRSRRRRIRAIIRKPADGDRLQLDTEALKDLLITVALPLLAITATVWFAARFVEPAPANTLVMTTGPDGGAYHLFAQRYRAHLARENISITLKPSAGSIENLQRLQSAGSDVEVGLVQAGLGSSDTAPGLRSLGAVYYEPLWLFYRGNEFIDRLSQLADKRVAIGAVGSGSRALALQLLKASGVDTSSPNLRPLGGNDAVKALIEEDVDAVLLVAAPDAPIVLELARTKDIKIASLVQAEAFARRFPFLAAIQLPRGAIDLAADIPGRDITLLATTATLVVKETFHPALGLLLLQAAADVHGRTGVLQKPGEFPAGREGEFLLADEAKRFYKSGPPFLQRYLPFWIANFIERMAVLLLPLVALILPLFKVLPALIQWRNKSRVFKWYGELKFLENQAATNPDPSQLNGYLNRLDEIEDGVNHTHVNPTYADYVYNLRMHIELVRIRLHRLDLEKQSN
ncbi:MAG: TAXI family TRAP transporter solute-binding subunit [Candidatus Binatia bacterium]